MACTAHALFVAWCHPPAPLGVIGCAASCPEVSQLALFAVPQGSPATSDTGQSCAGGAGSRVGGADHVVTRSALEAVPDALDARPVAEGAEPHPRAEVDPDDTSACPLAASCSSCGSFEELSVGTAESPVGVFCLTLCGTCAEAGTVPRIRPLEAVAAVCEHAGHLGCTVDDLAVTRTPGGAL